MRKIRLKKQKKTIDRYLFLVTILLTSLGLVAIADASAPQALNSFSDKFYFVKQQLIWGLLGFILLIVASKIHYTFWAKIAVPLFFISVIILILVLTPWLGVSSSGARRWVFLGPISIQPSEFVKLALAIYLAKTAEKNKSVFSFFIPLSIVAGLILMQPDFGTTVVVTLIGAAQVFASGIKLIPFFGSVLAGGIIGTIAILVSDYRKERVLTYLKYSSDPLGSAYHIRQVLLALGSGGIFGVGLGQSRQKYLFLPEAATDSIFAVIAEEVGFVGTVILIIIFAVFIIRGLSVARRAPDIFSRVLAVGIVTWIGGQAFVNMSSMTALLPLTGIPLPFFSYGGSALTMILLATGILLNISRYAKEGERKRK